MGRNSHLAALFEIGQPVGHLRRLAADARIDAPVQDEFLGRILRYLSDLRFLFEMQDDPINDAGGIAFGIVLKENLVCDPTATVSSDNALHGDGGRVRQGRKDARRGNRK